MFRKFFFLFLHSTLLPGRILHITYFMTEALLQREFAIPLLSFPRGWTLVFLYSLGHWAQAIRTTEGISTIFIVFIYKDFATVMIFCKVSAPGPCWLGRRFQNLLSYRQLQYKHQQLKFLNNDLTCFFAACECSSQVPYFKEMTELKTKINLIKNWMKW